MSTIKHIIFDFDGTCTQIPAVYEAFSDAYRRSFETAISASVSTDEWTAARDAVRDNSPCEGWGVANTPSAPIAADPYILADESAKLISRKRNLAPPPGSGLHSAAYHQHEAPWRPEALDVLREVHGRGIGMHFVSNSSSKSVSARLDELLKDHPEVRQAVSIESDAGKFIIKELTWGAGFAAHAELRAKFAALPVADDKTDVPFSRPIYLRRGSYFEALCRALGNNPEAFADTLVCGDVWELDLAMPFHLGMHVHLIERAAPFSTYPYEHAKIASCGAKGGRSDDLSGLLKRL